MQIHPVFGPRERRFTGSGRFEISKWRWNHGQRAFGKRLVMTVLPNDRERLPPIALAAEEPIANFVIDRFSPQTILLQPISNFPFRLWGRHPCNRSRVDARSQPHES